MRIPGVGDVVTVSRAVGDLARATVAKSYKRRFIVIMNTRATTALKWEVHLTFERKDEGKTWVRGWDTVDAVAWRAEKALAACR